GRSNTCNITNSRCSHNPAENGGGILGAFFDSVNGLSMSGSFLSGNVATINGGAIFGQSGFAMNISDTTVDLNVAGNNGGGIFASNANFSLRSSPVSNNEAGATGGAS